MIPKNPIQISVFEKYPNFERFMDVHRPANLIILYDDINTVNESISQLRLSLADINYMYTDGNSHPGVEYIQRWLDNLNIFSNIRQPLKDTYSVAAYLFGKYNHLYLTDLKIIFERIMRKEKNYGPFYGSVDAQVIIAGFDHYSRERATIHKTEEQSLKMMLNKELEKAIESQRLIVRGEYEKELGEKWLDKGKEIRIEAHKRAETEQKRIRDEFYQKYGIR